MFSSPMNAKLFINYRRDDTAPYAGRLYDRLIAHFGEDQVFIDIDQIEPGEDFVEVINRKVGTCDIAIVAIGPHWLGATDASGKRRLDDEEDFVRMEIVAALQRNIRVIPVLVGGAQMPRKQELPETLAPLSRRNAIELSETRFHADVNRLIEAIEKSFAVVEKKVELSTTAAAPPPEAPAVGPPEPESKVLLQSSESTERAEPNEHEDIESDAVSGAAPVSLGETTDQFLTEAAQPCWASEKSQQNSVATAKDSTTSAKSTQATPTAPSPVESTSSIVGAALKELKVWTWERRISVSAIALLVLALAGFGIKKAGTPPEPKPTDQGSPARNYDLGVRYQYGQGVTQDLITAAELYQKAADQGYAPAQAGLGWLYDHGEGVSKDLGKARELYQKAADQGNVMGQLFLGTLYEQGEGVPKDLGKARELYQKAADQGYDQAVSALRALPRQ